jgi:hypothetical protein
VAAGRHALGQVGDHSVIAVFALPAPNRFGLVDQGGTATMYEIAGSGTLANP